MPPVERKSHFLLSCAQIKCDQQRKIKVKNLLWITLLVLCTSLIAGGGEGSSVGGNSKDISNLLEKARAKSFFVDIPTLAIQGKQIPVIYLCLERDTLRTFRPSDNYPEYLSHMTLEDETSVTHPYVRYNRNFNVTLYQRIDLDYSGATIHATSRIDRIRYMIPECQSR